MALTELKVIVPLFPDGRVSCLQITSIELLFNSFTATGDNNRLLQTA